MIGNRSHNFSGDSIDLLLHGRLFLVDNIDVLLHGRLFLVDNISCIFWTSTNISKLHRNEEGMGQSRQRLETDLGKIWRVE